MKVFLSAVLDEVQPYYDALKSAIEAAGYEAIVLEPPPIDATSRKEAFKRLGESHVFIGIYGHRYGHMIRGEATSILEQLYFRAKDGGKDVFVFCVDPHTDWPAEFMEDDFIKRQRLEKFEKTLTSDKNSHRFKSPEDITGTVLPFLKVLSQKYDRIKLLNKWSSELPHATKVSLLESLAEANRNREIPNHLFRQMGLMIAGNFKMPEDVIPEKIISSTELLLKKEIDTRHFIADLQRTPRSKWDGFYRDHLGKFIAVVALAGLLAGILIGRQIGTGAESQGNLPPAESAALHAPVQPADGETEAGERMPAQVEETGPDDTATERPGSESSTPAIEDPATAIEVTEPPQRTASAAPDPILEEPVDDRGEESISTREPAVPESDLAEQKPAGIPEEASTAAVEAPEIETTEQNQPAEPAAQNQPNPVTPPKDDAILDAQLQRAASDTIIINDLLDSWRLLSGVSSLSDSARQYIDYEIGRLEDIIATAATIPLKDNFLVCKNVNTETRLPEDTTSQFEPGQVWMWARISTPAPDVVTAKWYTNGRLYYTKSANINVASPGYRVYFSHTHASSRQGHNEVKMYNSQNALIGRRVFYIETDTVTRR